MLLHALCLLLAVSCRHALCTGKKRLLETLSFDIKPSGQITHQTIKLVSHPSGVDISTRFTNSTLGIYLTCPGVLGEWSHVCVHVCCSRRYKRGMEKKANCCASHSCHGYWYTSMLPLICVVSNQEWSMSLQKTGKSAYTCKIERYVDPLKTYYMVVMRYVLMPHFSSGQSRRPTSTL